MRRIVISLLFNLSAVFTVLLGAGAVQACSPGPGLLFGTPTFIDPDQGRTTGSYGRRRNFHFLIEPYVKLVPHRELYVDGKLVNDTPHRHASAIQEPVAHKLYLTGADHFNNYEYSLALNLFKQSLTVTDSNSIWVREASTYMIARTLLCMSQRRWDGYWDDSYYISQDTVSLADEAYSNYLTSYPLGLYAESSREIKRRIFYLQGNVDSLDQSLKLMLARALDTALVDSGRARITGAVMQETYAYLSGQADYHRDHPFVIGLSLLSEIEPNQSELEKLSARKHDFDQYPGLFGYLYSLLLYRLGDYDKVLEETNAVTNSATPLHMSTLVLRARSYSHLGQDSASLATIALLHKVKRDLFLDIELAMHAKQSGALERLFTSTGPAMSDVVLAFSASYGFSNFEIESALAKPYIVDSKRQFLARELAHRYLMTSRYRECNELLSREHLIEFDSIRHYVKTLSQDSNNVVALANLGEYLVNHSIGPHTSWNVGGIPQELTYGLMETDRRCYSCFAVDPSSINYRAPIDLFSKVVEVSRRTGKRSEAEAKALHYVVFSNKPGKQYEIAWSYRYGYKPKSIDCKAAFQRLHRLYKDSPWAKATPYYYK